MEQSLHMRIVPAANIATLKEFCLQGLGWTIWIPFARPAEGSGIVLEMP